MKILSKAILFSIALGFVSHSGVRANEVSTGTTDLGFFVAEDPTKVNSGGDTTSNLYKLSSDGAVTLLQEDIFPDVGTNSFTSSNYAVDESKGKIYFLEDDRGGGAARRYRKYDIESNEFEDYVTVTGLPSGAVPINIGVVSKRNDTAEKKCITSGETCSDGDTEFVSLGGSGTSELIRVDSDGISTGGSSSKSLVKYVGDELHIGENSWITKEEGGRQKVYAKDASGNPIPIDYTNGTRLLINGRDVEKSIDNVGALSAALGSIPAISADSQFTCGFGGGTHSNAYALSAGCASRVSERVSLNAALATVINNQTGDTDDNLSARAGFTFRLGKVDDSPKVAARKAAELSDEVAKLREENKAMRAESLMQQQVNASLLARLERLEKIASGQLSLLGDRASSD